MKRLKELFRYPVIGIDRILSSGIRWQLLFLVVVIAFFILLFIVIEWATGSTLTIKENEPRNILLDVYYHFADPGNQYVVEGFGNRLLALFVSITGSVLMGGLLISIFSNIIDRRVERAREGQISYKFKNHYVIIGFNKMAIGFIKQLYRKAQSDDRVKDVPYLFVIQTTSNVETVRHELLSKLDTEIDRRTIILHGGRDSREDLERLQLPYCQEIFLLGEEGETDHDSVNIESVKLINQILRECKRGKNSHGDKLEISIDDQLRGNYKKCNVLLENQFTVSIFERFDVESILALWGTKPYDEVNKRQEGWSKLLQEYSFNGQPDRHIDFIPFNFYEMWAEKVFVWSGYNSHSDDRTSVVYTPLDGEGIDYESDRYVHLVVVGMTRMGVALAMKAAHIAHYPNFVRDPKLKTRITFIDLNADTEFDMLRGRYSALFEQCDYQVVDTLDGSRSYVHEGSGLTDIEFEFVKGAVESRPVQQLLKKWASPDIQSLLTIAICFESSQKSIATALYMPQGVYGKVLSILVRQNVSSLIVELVRNSLKYKNLRAFGMLDEENIVDNDILRFAKRVNFVYNTIRPNDISWKSLDDEKAEELWKNLLTVHRWSNIYNALSIPTKLRSFGLEEPENLREDKDLLEKMAEVEHNRWVMERLIQGYRPTTIEEDSLLNSVAGDREERENIRNKLSRVLFAHDCLRPYDALSESFKDYDRMIMKYLWRINKPLDE